MVTEITSDETMRSAFFDMVLSVFPRPEYEIYEEEHRVGMTVRTNSGWYSVYKKVRTREGFFGLFEKWEEVEILNILPGSWHPNSPDLRHLNYHCSREGLIKDGKFSPLELRVISSQALDRARELAKKYEDEHQQQVKIVV